MDNPRVQRYGNVWTLVWDDLQLGMGFDHVHDTRDDGIAARLVIRSRRPETRRALAGPLNLNLLSATSQSSLANSLAKRFAEVPWHDLLTLACALVVDAYSEASPTIYTDEVPLDTLQLECLVAGPSGIPLIPMGETTFAYGDSESLKSFLCQVIASCIAAHVALPWGELPSRRLRILYLDWETNEVVIADRMARIAAGLRIEPIHMAYRGALRTREAPPLRMLDDEVDAIRAQVQREQIGLVLVDSIGFAVRGKLVDDDVARGAMAALRQIPATRLVVAHISKESAQQQGGRVDPFGSTFFRAGLRSGFQVVRSEEPAPRGVVDLAVRQWKTNDGERNPPFGLRVCFDGPRGPVTFVSQSLMDIPDLSRQTSVVARLQEVMRHGLQTTGELAETLDEKEDTIRRTLNRHKDRLFLQVVGGTGEPNRWGNLA